MPASQFTNGTKLDRFLSHIASTDGKVLVATDFDGTLTRVVARPDAAYLDEDARQVLVRLSRLSRVQLAVLTGRSLNDISSRLEGISPLWISAEHGAVLLDPARKVLASSAPIPRDSVDVLRARSEEIAALFEGALVEPKELGIALHYRAVAPEAHGAVVQMFQLVCSIHGAELMKGRAVVEGRFSRSDKGVALARILGEMPRTLSFVYAGDDVTDEPALSMASLSENGLGLYVSSKERPSPTTRVTGLLEGPAEWVHILGLLATTLERAEERRAS